MIQPLGVWKEKRNTPEDVPVHAHEQHSSHERPKDLREYIMGDFLPGETLPDSEAYRDGWIEVTTRCRGTGDDSKSNTNRKAPADLKDTTECCRIRLRGIDVEGSDGCYAGKAGAQSLSGPCNDLWKTLTHRRRLL